MSKDEELRAFDDYREFEGNQSACQKILVICLNRLRVFYRSPFQWFIFVIPTLYVVIQLFIVYAIVASLTEGKGTNKIITIMFTFYFTLFLVLGQLLTASVFGFAPMQERKEGLRQMMHMSGLSSIQYYAGLFLGDLFLFSCSGVVLSLALIPFPQIMVGSQIFNFFISYVFFGAALINMCYILAHIFSEAETGQKYLGVLILVGFLVGPIVLSLIFAAILGFEHSISGALSVWYYIDPVVAFILTLYNQCCIGKPDLD